VSVIVVTWNGKKYALECVESLIAQQGPTTCEIIVVDNGSTDGTPDAITVRFPSVRLIRNSANLGFARANNIGMGLSRGRYVCLVNSDVVVPPGCLDHMVAFLDTHPEVGLLGPKMLSPEGGHGASVMRLPTVGNTLCCALGLHKVFPASSLLGGFSMDAYPYDKTETVEVLTGWFWMVPRQALEKVGGLDEQFFMYGEDIDWCHRFRDAGWRVVFYPEAAALHYGAASSKAAPKRFYVEMRRANLQYFRKHHGIPGVFGYYAAIWLHELVRISAYLVLCIIQPRRGREARGKIGSSIASIRWLLGDKSLLTAPQKTPQRQ
jgi:hypothetical protein